MSEQQSCPLSRREKIAFFMTGLLFEGMGVEAIAGGEVVSGTLLAGLGLGGMAVAKWGEFKSLESAHVFDFYTGTSRDETGQPL